MGQGQVSPIVLSEALHFLQVVVYATLALLALLQWKRRPGAAAAWMCVAFGVLATFFIADSVFDYLADRNQRVWIGNIPIALLPLFAYSLYAFMSTFVRPSPVMRIVAPAATGAISLAALMLPTSALAEPPVWVQIWVACLLLQWLGLSGIVVVRLWRAGSDQPPFARRRMRTMSIGVAGFAVAALLEGQLGETSALGMVVLLLALTSALCLWIGFVPPYALRQWWRRREEGSQGSTELALMGATTPAEIAELLLNESCALLGGAAARLETIEGEVVASKGETRDPRGSDERVKPSVIEIEMGTHRLVTFANEFTPFFGDEETSRLRALAALAEVALERNALSDDQRQLARVVESTSDAIIIQTPDGVVTSWNRGAMDLYGYTADEVIGKKMDLVEPRGAQDVPKILKIVRSGRSVSNYEATGVSKEGRKLYVSVSASPLRDRSGEIVGVATSARDVTEAFELRAEQKHIEEALRKARLEAERANASKTEFLSRVSHELRTPLNAILGFAQLLELDELTEDQSDNVEQILKGGRRLLELINEVLDISRIESGRLRLSLEPVPVTAAVREAIRLIGPMADQRGIRIDDEVAEDVHVQADQQRLGQALLNLLSNAVKYNVEGGSVCVTSEATRDWVRIGIADTGPGIPEDRLELLFTPFERLGAELTGVEGVGLGLALTQSLVDAMGGELEVDTRIGEGTTFSIHLHRSEVDDDMSAKEDSMEGSSPALRGSVLYIEDNESNLRLVERLLDRTQVSLISTMTGREGVGLASEHLPDLILLDVHLPDMQGSEVLTTILNDRRTSSIPVVILSADATTDQIDRLVGMGAAGYLTKPIDVPGFFRVLSGFLGDSERVPTDG